MTSQPEIPSPDRIEPQSPPERPVQPEPAGVPFEEPDEITPIGPDTDNPGKQPTELPPVPD